MDGDGAGLHLHILPLAGEVVGAPAVDQDGAVGGGRLFDGAGAAGQYRLHLRQRRAMVAGGDFLALQVPRVRLDAETDGEILGFVAAKPPTGEPGRLDWKSQRLNSS